MDSALVIDKSGELWVREMRRVRAGELVAIGKKEDGTEGIFVHTEAAPGHSDGEFKFMASEVSREKPVDYVHLANLLIEERERGGYVVWVTGPALVHSRARSDMVWFIRNGFVNALLAGNAVAVHDIEASIFGTTLGMTGSGESTVGWPRPPHARDQQGARRRFHERAVERRDHGRHHARLRAEESAVRAVRIHS